MGDAAQGMVTGNVRLTMAGYDCDEIGRSSCPCGEGEIVVEHCTPDHMWARASQSIFRNSLICTKCELTYVFFSRDPGSKARLVLKEDDERIGDAQSAWHKTLLDIQNSEIFQELTASLAHVLSEQPSAAAAHRLLRRARLTNDSLYQYRKHGYRLSPLYANAAAKLLVVDDDELAALVYQEREYAERMSETPEAIVTGNNGLEK